MEQPLDPFKILDRARIEALANDNEFVGSFAWQALFNAGAHIRGWGYVVPIAGQIYSGIGGAEQAEAFLEAARARHAAAEKLLQPAGMEIPW